MKSDLRKNPLRSLGRYWLTMADSAAFTLVSSAIAIAEELRRELADQTGLVTRSGSAELALLLLTAADAGWGRGKAGELVSQIVDTTSGHAGRHQARASLLVRNAVSKLPPLLWPEEKLTARRELLEELSSEIRDLQAAPVARLSPEEQRERVLREALAASRARLARPPR